MRSQLVPLEGKTALVQQGHPVMMPSQAEQNQPCVIWGLSLLQEQDHRLYPAVNLCLLTTPCSYSSPLFSFQPWRKGCFLCPDPLPKHPPLPFTSLEDKVPRLNNFRAYCHQLKEPSAPRLLPTVLPTPYYTPWVPLQPQHSARNIDEYVMFLGRIILTVCEWICTGTAPFVSPACTFNFVSH